MSSEPTGERAYRLQGFTKAEAVLLEGDSLHHAARWEKSRLVDVPEGRYILRLHLEGDAMVYALTIHRKTGS